MPGIRKRGSVVVINDTEDESISYCQRCIKYNVHSVLGERIYKSGEVPYDHENWKQCPNCGTIVPIYETKKESRLQDFVEVSDDPFDAGQTITGIGNKKPKSSYQIGREKLLERIENEKDEDIKQALRKGNTVKIIEDS